MNVILRNGYFRQSGPSFPSQPHYYSYHPSYTFQPNHVPLTQNVVHRVPPYVPNQINHTSVSNLAVSRNQTDQTSSNVPHPGPHQNWIYQPSDTYFFLGDHNASYYIFPYEADPTTEIVIRGRYPYARYFTFNVANIPTHRLVDAIVGRDLIPDPGSTNPFFPGGNWDATNRNYTLKIRFTEPPEGSNLFVPDAGNNVIYAGTLESGAPNRTGFIILRIYVPSIGYDKTGGVDLPFITYAQNSSLPSAAFQTTTQQHQLDFDDFMNLNEVANMNTRNNIENNFRQNVDLIWKRFGPEFLQPEGNTIYTISNLIDRDPNKLLYIRWKAPTFPDTYHNFGITGDEDMQYWSMNFVTPVGMLGLYTISDYQTIIDNEGYVNLVISFGAPRPSSVTSENGYTWIDASQLPLVPLFLIYRNNQISENFIHYTAADIRPGEVVTPQDMGEYYPSSIYVDPMDFE